MNFKDFIQDAQLLQVLCEANLLEATDIQQLLFPAMAAGQDCIAISPTGTGKTEAFVIPILAQQLLGRKSTTANTLILCPTRELALQTQQRIQRLAQPLGIGSIAIYGGNTYAQQADELALNPQLIIATPGRLLDLMAQEIVSLAALKTLVIDEIDQLLDLGFLGDVQRILGAIPAGTQKVFVSATLPVAVEKLALKVLNQPLKLQATAQQYSIKEQVLFVDKDDKKELINHLLLGFERQQIIIFSRTVHAVERIVSFLNKEQLRSAALYGDKAQAQREQILSDFKNQHIQILVATDIATRGLDIPDLAAVINYEVPTHADSYTHRIGRTGRSRAGNAIILCDAEDNKSLIALQTALKKTIPVNDQHPYVLSWQKMLAGQEKKQHKKGKRTR